MLKKYFFYPFFFLFISSAQAEDLATLYSAEGYVEGSFNNKDEWINVNTGKTFNQNDKVRTLDNSRAGIKFRDGFLIRLSPKASITFTDQTSKESAQPVSVLSGITHFLSRKAQSFPKINTPHVSASVRGTEFTIEVTDKQTKLSVLDGEVFLENQAGSLAVKKGEAAITESGKAPVKSINLDLEGSVEWALYYPPTLDASQINHTYSNLTDKSEKEALKNSLNFYKEGKYTKALGEITPISNTTNLAILTYISALKLSLGDVLGAEKIHTQIESSGQEQSKVKSLLASQKAIILLAQNHKDKAAKLINASLEENDKDEALLLVSSYLDQADHNLESAKEKLKTILNINPKNELAKARLAEIHLAFGERDEALALLGEDKDIKSSYGQAVLGFSYLTQKESNKAVNSFSKAIELDQSSALPHLGLGLAYISQGDLIKGRTELEYAVQLEPTVAIYRSYLGKAYFEEASGKNANKEFNRAMELDPEDPTPYLYRSYLNLVEHKPVAALRDIQSSIEKNDNRAVYRSSLMLDNDAATRTNGLGRIYSRVGFTELARVEAVKSLHKDYSNFSSHYLLATLLSETHLNSRAQTTENLLGRLLSPVTFNANNLSVGGEASLNEYTTLFDAPTERTVLEGRGDTVLKSAGGGVEHIRNTENLGMNFGYSYDYRGGFRDNDFERNQQLFSLGQYKLSTDSNLVWDSALTANDRGDLLVNRNQYEEDKDIETDFESALLRGGYHLRISPSTHFITQAFYNYGDTQENDPNNSNRINTLVVTNNGQPITRDPFRFDGLIDERFKRKENLGQLDAQFIIDKNLVSIVTGTSFRYSAINGKENGIISNPGSTPELSSLAGFPINSQNTNDQLTSRTYLYSTWHLTESLDIDAGATYTWLDFSDNALNTPYVEDGYKKDALDPKLGFLYQLTSSTSLRGAYAKTLDRTDRGNIGPLEPTFVGGFNQVFDGIQGSKQDFWGLGIDQKLSTETYVGVNYQNRSIDLNNPFIASRLAFDRTTNQVSEERYRDITKAGADEEKVGAYLYQILNDQFTLTLDYAWEYFKEIDPLPQSDTSKFGSQLNYFHPSGFFALSRANFRIQKEASGFKEQERDSFLLVDLGLGYEFDKRQGAITMLFNNIFDKSFNYSAIRDEQAIRPDFGAVLKASYSF
jgi:Tfp pilus assembly protein PilF